MSNVCVITDSISDDFYFKSWLNYYGKSFGFENIFVVTYESMVKTFCNYDLGGVWGCKLYDDSSRVGVIEGLVRILLERYKYVIRVDTDEFLVPDPRLNKNLPEYIDSLDRPYVTAYGYDVIQGREEGPLNLTLPILIDQRRYTYPYDALNKTCITRIPLRWAPGFHFCSVYPEFNNLYLFHMKRADIDIQVEIGKAVASRAQEGASKNYHLVGRDMLIAHNASALQAPLGLGWSHFSRGKYNDDFLKKIKFITNYGGIYQGADFNPEKILAIIPDDFIRVF